jgi:hypothetical protein
VAGLLQLPGTDLLAQLGSQSQGQGLLSGGGLGDGTNGLGSLSNLLGLPGMGGSLGDGTPAVAGLTVQSAGAGVVAGASQQQQQQQGRGVPDLAALAAANATAAAQAAKELTSVVQATSRC